MSRAIQSWTPRSRPLIYDSLQQDAGCQPVKFGNKVYASLPFSRICIFEHTTDPDSPFNLSDQISYAVGPLNTGDPLPWSTAWVAWSGSDGIRIAKLPEITLPANNIGEASSYYPTTVSSKVALGFTTLGQVAIAIQKTEETIEIKWLKSTDGTNLQTRAFLGLSPVLQNNALLQYSPDGTINDLALYYVRLETPSAIYARFEREDFETEHLVNTGLQANVTRLILSEVQGSKQVVYARDAINRDVTLYSDSYSIDAGSEEVDLSLSFSTGNYVVSSVKITTVLDKTKLSLLVKSGAYNAPVVDAPSLPQEELTLSVGITEGEYN